MNVYNPYKKLDYYPHMRPQDIALWERFIAAHPDAYDYVEYDVAVGEGPEFDTIVNAATGGDDARLYKKKIDVVGHKGDRVDIIEVKPNAGLGVFGQVLSYEIMYLEHVNSKAKTRPCVITDRMAPDMKKLSDAHAVIIYVV